MSAAFGMNWHKYAFAVAEWHFGLRNLNRLESCLSLQVPVGNTVGVRVPPFAPRRFFWDFLRSRSQSDSSRIGWCRFGAGNSAAPATPTSRAAAWKVGLM